MTNSNRRPSDDTAENCLIANCDCAGVIIVNLLCVRVEVVPTQIVGSAAGACFEIYDVFVSASSSDWIVVVFCTSFAFFFFLIL
jgi:hypothetical protein